MIGLRAIKGVVALFALVVTFGAPQQVEAGEDKGAFLERARDAVIALREVE